MPRTRCRQCGGPGPFHGDAKDRCRRCFDGTPRQAGARPDLLSPCAGCGKAVPGKARVKVDGAQKGFCPACVGPAKRAAQERMVAQQSGGKKRKAAATGACVGGQPHLFVLVQDYDELHRCGDRGTCSSCGLVRFWLRPGQEGPSYWKRGLKMGAA